MAKDPSKQNIQESKKGVGVNGNLIPPKKGETRNPNGRPKKGYAIADILNSSLDKKVNGKSQRHIILEKVIDEAIGGDHWAIQFIADRTEGKALERIIRQEITDEIVLLG